ncbi:hypothetical protein N2152v2_002319 [Parachlorella kessleri]
MSVLPVTDSQLVRQCQRDYEEAAQHGGQEALDACYRLSWALVHSSEKRDIQRGLELCEAMLSGGSSDQRELLYLVAVSKYRQKRFIECRRSLKSLMEVYPEFRQAEALLEACEKEIVTDGLIGVGAGAAVIGIVAAVAAAALSRR